LPDIMIVQPRRYGFSLLLASFSAAAGAIAALLLS
jgi:hypothetical protein